MRAMYREVGRWNAAGTVQKLAGNLHRDEGIEIHLLLTRRIGTGGSRRGADEDRFAYTDENDRLFASRFYATFEDGHDPARAMCFRRDVSETRRAGGTEFLCLHRGRPMEPARGRHARGRGREPELGAGQQRQLRRLATAERRCKRGAGVDERKADSGPGSEHHSSIE